MVILVTIESYKSFIFTLNVFNNDAGAMGRLFFSFDQCL
jgi:hypothetical protein